MSSKTPQSDIITCFFAFPESLPQASIAFRTSIPSVTFPKTTCLPSSLRYYNNITIRNLLLL